MPGSAVAAGGRTSDVSEPAYITVVPSASSPALDRQRLERHAPQHVVGDDNGARRRGQAAKTSGGIAATTSADAARHASTLRSAAGSTARAMRSARVWRDIVVTFARKRGGLAAAFRHDRQQRVVVDDELDGNRAVLPRAPSGHRRARPAS